MECRESIDYKQNRKIINELLKKLSTLKGNPLDDQKRFVSDYLKEKDVLITQLYDEDKNTCTIINITI